jgi:type IV secretion system protein VirB8
MLSLMLSFFKKKEKEDSLAARKSWYEDRYQTVVVQRNFLILLIMSCLVGIMISTLGVIEVTSSKKIEPFVIEIEEKTGVTNVIRPLLLEQINQDEVMKRYFIVKYIKAREEYRKATFEYQYGVVVSLLSKPQVYYKFRSDLAKNGPNTPVALGANVREVKINSVVKLATPKDSKNQVYQVRFSNVGANEGKSYIATIEFVFEDLELNFEQRNINPLGFQVTGYSVNEENL